MKTEKLSFDAFKLMAENVQTNEIMNQIEGGNLFDCHGFWGGVGKKIRDIVVGAAIRELEEALD